MTKPGETILGYRIDGEIFSGETVKYYHARHGKLNEKAAVIVEISGDDRAGAVGALSDLSAHHPAILPNIENVAEESDRTLLVLDSRYDARPGGREYPGGVTLSIVARFAAGLVSFVSNSGGATIRMETAPTMVWWDSRQERLKLLGIPLVGASADAPRTQSDFVNHIEQLLESIFPGAAPSEAEQFRVKWRVLKHAIGMKPDMTPAEIERILLPRKRPAQIKTVTVVLVIFGVILAIAAWKDGKPSVKQEAEYEVVPGVSSSSKKPDQVFWKKDEMHMIFVDPKDGTKAFYMDRHEVSNRQYRKFVDETGYRGMPLAESDWQKNYAWRISGAPFDESRSDQPVVLMTVQDAEAYARWAGKRLPTEREFRLASGAAWGERYPWGNTWDDRNIRLITSSVEADIRTPTEWVTWLKTYRAGDAPNLLAKWTDGKEYHGLIHLLGNVEEYATTTESGYAIVGGSAVSMPADVENPASKPADTGKSPFVGFRCVIDADGVGQ